jgi:hypothetical protein
MRVPGVTGIDRPVDGLGDGRREGDVHLGDPQRQHIGRVRTPLHAGAVTQLLERQLLEWVSDHSRNSISAFRHGGRASAGDERVLGDRQGQVH